jgi:hypothetical protein
MTATGRAGQEVNAVWLTTDAQADGHGVYNGGELTAKEKMIMGVPVGEPAFFPDKTAIRIKIKWPSSKVKRWLPWARRRVESSVIKGLIEAGGGMQKAKTWHLSFSPIPPSAFLEVRDLSKVGVSNKPE